MSISFKGIPVAKLRNEVVVSGDQYTIRGSARTNKFVSIVIKSKGSFQSSGTISGRSLKPNDQSSKLRRGKKNSASTLTFQNSNVIKVAAKPAIKYKNGSIPVTPDHFKKVVDPVSTLVFPLAKSEKPTGENVCNRTVPVFDGKHRLNLAFRYKATGKAVTGNTNGIVYRCSVQYRPVSGHRPASKSNKFMRSTSGIEVSMVQVGDTNVFALYGFTIPIRTGVIRGTAFEYSQN